MSTTTQNEWEDLLARSLKSMGLGMSGSQAEWIFDFVRQQRADARKEGTKAGFQEGRERVISAMLQELDLAKQNKESADDPEDPKVRIKYFEDLLLRFEGATLRKESP